MITFPVVYRHGYSKDVILDIVRISREGYQGLSCLSLWDEEDNEHYAHELFTDGEGRLVAICSENF